nr:MAG TPA: hypothetical protein [Caudoviricetes sp.]
MFLLLFFSAYNYLILIFIQPFHFRQNSFV